MEALKYLFFWKGTYKFEICGFEVFIPLRSIVIFIGANIMVEFPQYTPCIISACLAWILLKMLDLELERPSPWSKPKTFMTMANQIIRGESRSENIEPNENADSNLKYLSERFPEQTEEQILEETLRTEDYLNRTKTLDREITQFLPKNEEKKLISPTRVPVLGGKVSSKYLLLESVIHYFRFIERVLTWQQSALTFGITSCLFLFSIFSAVLIHFGIWIWLKRSIVWVFMGPWCRFLNRFETIPDENNVTLRSNI